MSASDRDVFTDEFNVSRETLERLDVYHDQLARWTERINLVSKTTMAQLWQRHFMDSAQLLKLAPSGSTWSDLGSGGGFPGAVVAIIAAEIRKDLTITLIEADKRKAAFLRTVLRETGIQARVIADRIEKVEPMGAEILSARALAPLSKLLSYSERHLSSGGRALFLKGENAPSEVRDALEHWRFDCETHKSMTDEKAVVLSIGDIERV